MLGLGFYLTCKSASGVTTALRHDRSLAVSDGVAMDFNGVIWGKCCVCALSLSRFQVMMFGLWAVSSMVEQ